MKDISANKITYPTGIERIILVITAISCAVLELIDSTVVNVSLREISGSIGVTTTEIAWVITAYGVANVIMIPLSGMLSTVLGRKRYFTFSVIVFTLSSLMCGLSSSLWVLVFWRFIQGLGGGGLLSTAQSIIVDAFPPDKVAVGVAIFGLGVILGPTFGPVLGGYITDNLSWHWIFFINIPVGIIAAFLSWSFVPDLIGVIKPPKIDWLGIGLLIAMVGPLQYVLEEGAAESWFESTEITVLFIISMISLVFFIWREWTFEFPAVNIRLYKNFNLAMGSILNLLLGLILTGTVFIFPLFVQTVLGWSATQTGAFMIPGALASAVGMMIVGKLNGKINPKILSIIGVCLTFIFLYMLSFSSPDSSETDFFWPFIIRGLGVALMMMPILTMAMSGLRGKELAQATGLSNMMRQLGGAIGVAFINLILDHKSAAIKSNMIQYVSDNNPISTERINMFTQSFIQSGYSTDEAFAMANKMMESSLVKQQLMVNYSQGFLMVGLIILICIPLILLVKNTKTDPNVKIDLH